MLKYIIFIIAVGTLCCCKKPFITITRSKATPKNVIAYPPEKSEIATMEIGDTINIFYKKTGWFKSKYTFHEWANFSFYTMETIWRDDTAKYSYVGRWAYPDAKFGGPLYFDSLKHSPSILFETIGRLEYFCFSDSIVEWNMDYQPCLWTFNYPPTDSLHFSEMASRELSSQKYQKWRFTSPSKKDLENWYESLPQNASRYCFEMLVLTKDTCKLSYSDDIDTPFFLVFPK